MTQSVRWPNSQKNSIDFLIDHPDGGAVADIAGRQAWQNGHHGDIGGNQTGN